MQFAVVIFVTEQFHVVMCNALLCSWPAMKIVVFKTIWPSLCLSQWWRKQISFGQADANLTLAKLIMELIGMGVWFIVMCFILKAQLVDSLSSQGK